MGEFNFRDLIPRGSGARQAIERELQRRIAIERTTHPTRLYPGAASILSQHGQFFTGRELPDKYAQHQGQEGRCHANALTLVRAVPGVRYFTGWYCIGGAPKPHSWGVDEEGVIEVTFPTRQDNPLGLIYTQDSTGKRPWVTPDCWSYIGIELHPDVVVDYFTRFNYSSASLIDADPSGVDLETDPDFSDCYLHLPYDPDRRTL
jgi:hypothetical protein